MIPEAEKASQPFSLRLMVPADLDAVDALNRESFDQPWSKDLLRRELEHDWSTVILAVDGSDAKDRERIIGFIVFWLVNDEVHILNLATSPAHRRRGVARALLADAEEMGLSKGAGFVTLEVRRSNAPAITLYEDLGFRLIGVRPEYYLPDREDAFVMSKTLSERDS